MHNNKYQSLSRQTDYLKMNSTDSNITNFDNKTWAANEGVGEEVLLQRLIEYYIDAFNINDTAVPQIHEYEEVVFNIDKLNIHQYIVLGMYQRHRSSGSIISEIIFKTNCYALFL